MEIVALLRGEHLHMQEWISILKSAFWPCKAQDDRGSIFDGLSRTGISPIIPISIRFPEPSLLNVLGMIKPEGNQQDHIFDANLKSKFLRDQIKKSLGLENLPENWEEFKHPITDFLKLQKVGIHLIGIHKDIYNKDGIELI